MRERCKQAGGQTPNAPFKQTHSPRRDFQLLTCTELGEREQEQRRPGAGTPEPAHVHHYIGLFLRARAHGQLAGCGSGKTSHIAP